MPERSPRTRTADRLRALGKSVWHPMQREPILMKERLKRLGRNAVVAGTMGVAGFFMATIGAHMVVQHGHHTTVKDVEARRVRLGNPTMEDLQTVGNADTRQRVRAIIEDAARDMKQSSAKKKVDFVEIIQEATPGDIAGHLNPVQRRELDDIFTRHQASFEGWAAQRLKTMSGGTYGELVRTYLAQKKNRYMLFALYGGILLATSYASRPRRAAAKKRS